MKLLVARELAEEDQGFAGSDDEDKENMPAPRDTPPSRPGLLWVEKYTPARYTDLLSEEVGIDRLSTGPTFSYFFLLFLLF